MITYVLFIAQDGIPWRWLALFATLEQTLSDKPGKLWSRLGELIGQNIVVNDQLPCTF